MSTIASIAGQIRASAVRRLVGAIREQTRNAYQVIVTPRGVIVAGDAWADEYGRGSASPRRWVRESVNRGFAVSGEVRR